MRRLTVLAFAFFILATYSIVLADNWPQWRGPQGNGVAAAGAYPIKFASDENVAWKAAMPGRGSSTPAVWGKRIFVTCGIDGQDGLLCFDTNGKELWRKLLGPEREAKHRNATGANPSPVTDGKLVVVYFKSGTLACFDFDGNEKWNTNLQERFGKDTLWWDLGTSPVLSGGRVIVAVVQAGESYLAAFELGDGKLAWRTPRQYECPPECDQTYSTPQVAKLGGRDVIVTWGADHLTGHDAATGKLLWECGGFNPDKATHWRTIASPTVGDGMAIVPYGRGSYLVGVRMEGEGDITEKARLWAKDGKGQAADVPSPVVADGKAYVLNDAGQINCFDLQTGEEQWKAELPKNRNRYYSSPVLAGDKLYCVREDGVAFVGQVSDTGFKQLAENDMGERILATPVLVDGGLLLRGEDHLFRIAAAGAAEK
ncbi:MAG: PQQ-binding-like beta-propeller repeat protein [Pirellulales bacterium]